METNKEVKKSPSPRKPKSPKYVSVIARMWSPDHNMHIELDRPVELKMCSWLERQIKAGLIKESK